MLHAEIETFIMKNLKDCMFCILNVLIAPTEAVRESRKY